MQAKNILSKGLKVTLPTAANPKVYIALDNRLVANQAFKLYNPFSKKGKILKYISRILCVYFRPIAKIVLPTFNGVTSIFIEKLEIKFGQKIQSSVYFSTAKDKIVVQLQNNGKIIGYLKYAISPIGEKRILNEQKAIQLLSSLKLAPKLLDADHYEGKLYIILENIEGLIGWVTDAEYHQVLKSLQKANKYTLNEHPRIHNLIIKLEEYQLHDLIQKLQRALEFSKDTYFEVFEHGDFAPWNLIQSENKVVAFDFEYFEEKGLQYLDEIKYHFQLNHLMHKKTGEDLIKSIADKISIPEFKSIFLVFLAKEIVNKCEANEPDTLERSLLKLLLLKVE